MNLPVDDRRQIGALFHVANDIERIGDHAENIADMAVMRKESGAAFSHVAQVELTEMLEMVNQMLTASLQSILRTPDTEALKKLDEMENRVDEKEKELQKNHIDRLTRQECTPEAGMIFSDVATALERVADHARNIAFYIRKRDDIV